MRETVTHSCHAEKKKSMLTNNKQPVIFHLDLNSQSLRKQGSGI